MSRCHTESELIAGLFPGFIYVYIYILYKSIYIYINLQNYGIARLKNLQIIYNFQNFARLLYQTLQTYQHLQHQKTRVFHDASSNDFEEILLRRSQGIGLELARWVFIGGGNQPIEGSYVKKLVDGG